MAKISGVEVASIREGAADNQLTTKLALIKKHELEGKLLIVKVGSERRPASQDDLDCVQEHIEEWFKSMRVEGHALITHHQINFKLIDPKQIAPVKTLKKVKL